jgi:class 3 adenylate cyclase
MNASEIRAQVTSIFATQWQSRDGRGVPDAEKITLSNDGVKLDGTVLYADLVESTDLVDHYKDFFAAEVYKAYLVAATRIIRSRGGEITAFDGDRVMAVFVGDRKNSNAARTALEINWAVKKVINPTLRKQYPNTSFNVRQVVGIDTGPLFVAKTGIRGSNDLVWVGRAANYAAKLCSLREDDYASIITESVFKKLSDETKHGGNPRQLMWDKALWTETGEPIYKSDWWWELS